MISGGNEDNYNIKWDGSTLTLNGAELTEGFYELGTVRAAVWYESSSNIEIKLIGENTIKGPDRNDDDGDRWSLGISANYAPITISGDGALKVSGGAVLSEGSDDTYSIGIYWGGLPINGSSVTAAGSETADVSVGAAASMSPVILSS